MHDRLPPKGMCSGSRGLLKFCEITYNISETVHDRDLVAMEQCRKSCGLLNGSNADDLK